jgi:ABC-type molybdenum transport system ATPase subunit/photorepair protein PhrA
LDLYQIRRIATRWGKRELNEISWEMNPNGEFFLFGEVGTGKDSVVVTLAYRSTQPAILKAFYKYKKYLGRPMNDVPREKK